MAKIPNIIQGDTFSYLHGQVGLSDLRFTLTGLTVFTKTAVGDSFSLTSAETSALPVGDYWYSIISFSGANRTTLATGTISVLPDPLLAINKESTSFNKRLLIALEAHIDGRATNGQLDHLRSVVGTKELNRMSLTDLLQLRNRLKSAVNAEVGKNPSRQILFTNR